MALAVPLMLFDGGHVLSGSVASELGCFDVLFGGVCDGTYATIALVVMQAAEQNNMDPSIAKKRMKKRRAPPPPNPFTGEVEELPPSVSDEAEAEDVRWRFWL